MAAQSVGDYLATTVPADDSGLLAFVNTRLAEDDGGKAFFEECDNHAKGFEKMNNVLEKKKRGVEIEDELKEVEQRKRRRAEQALADAENDKKATYEAKDAHEAAKANYEVAKVQRGWAKKQRDKLDAAKLAEIESESSESILKKWNKLSSLQQDKFIGLVSNSMTNMGCHNLDPAVLAAHLGAGQVSCGLLEAFKQQKFHFDSSTGRLSMTTASTARDSAAIPHLLKALNKTKKHL